MNRIFKLLLIFLMWSCDVKPMEERKYREIIQEVPVDIYGNQLTRIFYIPYFKSFLIELIEFRTGRFSGHLVVTRHESDIYVGQINYRNGAILILPIGKTKEYYDYAYKKYVDMIARMPKKPSKPLLKECCVIS